MWLLADNQISNFNGPRIHRETKTVLKSLPAEEEEEEEREEKERLRPCSFIVEFHCIFKGRLNYASK